MPALLITIVGSIIGLGAASLSFDLSPLGNWFVSAATWLMQLFQKIVVTVFLFCQDYLCWAFDALLSLVIEVLGGVCNACGLSGEMLDVASVFALLPAGLIGLLGALGFVDAIKLITCALIIRFVLQTIPFVRWGS